MIKTTIVIVILFSFFIFNEKYRIEETTISEDIYEAFLPVKYKDGILFSATEYPDETSNIYYAEIINKEELGEPIELELLRLPKRKREFYWRFSISPTHYIQETEEFFFTSVNREPERSKMTTFHSAIYKAKIEDFEIIDKQMLAFCKPYFDYAHPTFSTNGLRMILSSNEDGDFDFYEYSRSSIYDDDWKLVRSLDELNTIDFDYFPKLINDSILVFSSYGKEQSSSLNLYRSELGEDGKWEEPKKLEYLNSEYDDSGVLFIDEKSGYFTSNRNGQNSIFYFEREK